MKMMRLVCFGGGTGLSTLLYGLKHNPFLDTSAIVTMFDSGGSSRELSDRFGILPPGDILRCMLALAEDEEFVRKLLLTRIPYDGISAKAKKRLEAQYSSYHADHTAGNILLLGLEQVYGDLTTAIKIACDIMHVKGNVYPVSLKPSDLCASFHDGSQIRQETAIDKAVSEGKILEKLWLQPQVACNEEVIQVIESADVICIGPGSLYTSLLPNLLPAGVKEALQSSRAPIIYVLNLLVEGEGMRHLSVKDIVSILESYIGRPVTRAIVNSHVPADRLADYAAEGKYPIVYSGAISSRKYVNADLWTDPLLARHDSQRLAYLLHQVIGNLIK